MAILLKRQAMLAALTLPNILKIKVFSANSQAKLKISHLSWRFLRIITLNPPLVKWISHGSSKAAFRVRISEGGPNLNLKEKH